MLKSRHRGKYVLAIMAAAFLFTGVPASAAPIPIGELIVNGGFQNGGGAPSLASWTPSLTGAVNGRASTDIINTSIGNAGFNNFFGSAFAVLGDASGAIGDVPISGTSSISQSFTLPAIQGGVSIESYDITFRFYTAFNGDDSGATSSVKDLFSAELSGIPLFSQNSSPLPDCGPGTTCPNLQIVNNPFSDTIFGLEPGDYTLTFNLIELAGSGTNATNTAAGIDDVSVTGSANPVPVPEPGTLILLGSGLLGLVFMRKIKRDS